MWNRYVKDERIWNQRADVHQMKKSSKTRSNDISIIVVVCRLVSRQCVENVWHKRAIVTMFVQLRNTFRMATISPIIATVSFFPHVEVQSHFPANGGKMTMTFERFCSLLALQHYPFFVLMSLKLCTAEVDFSYSAAQWRRLRDSSLHQHHLHTFLANHSVASRNGEKKYFLWLWWIHTFRCLMWTELRCMNPTGWCRLWWERSRFTTVAVFHSTGSARPSIALFF